MTTKKPQTTSHKPHGKSGLASLWAAVLLLVAAGCNPVPIEKVEMPILVADYNVNAAKVPQLWSRAKVEVTIPRDIGSFTWGSTSGLAANNGYLVLFKNGAAGPHDFVLIGKEGPEEIFRLGSSTGEDAYYLWFKAGDKSGAWIGRLNGAGTPRGGDMPFNPTEFLSVLGIVELPGSSAARDVWMDKNPWHKEHYYVLTETFPTGKREMYFEWPMKLADPRPLRRVVMYDKANRAVMTANLSNYQTIADANGAQMPTDITIDWVGANGRTTTLALALSAMTAAPKAERSIVTLADHMPDIPPDKVNYVVGSGSARVVDIDLDPSHVNINVPTSRETHK